MARGRCAFGCVSADAASRRRDSSARVSAAPDRSGASADVWSHARISRTRGREGGGGVPALMGAASARRHTEQSQRNYRLLTEDGAA